MVDVFVVAILVALVHLGGLIVIQPGIAAYSFAGVVLVSISLLSLGFILASVVRTARFAQPIGSVLLYALLAISGLFFPLELLPRVWQNVALASPITHGVNLLRGLWLGEGWSVHWVAVAALVANLAICSAISKRVFRWE